MLEGSFLTFRRFSKEDKDLIFKLVSSFDIDTLKKIGYFDTPEELGNFMNFYYSPDVEENDKRAYIGLLNGEIVCFGCLRILPNKKGYLEGIMVRKDKQRQGIGTQLMRFLEEEANKEGLKVLSLEVFKNNNEAKNFYEKLGYTVERQSPSSFLMSKKIEER